MDVAEIMKPLGLSEIERGRGVLLKAVKTFPMLPGVYRMLGRNGDILYIGKAKNLKNRVTSYTQIQELVPRIRQMVARVHDIVFTVVDTEADALFLEADLIRTVKPPFNVLLKDSTPFVAISLSKRHPFPRIAKHRGPRDYATYDFCGPFASVKSVNEALLNIQKIFQLRTCSDSFFSARKRPCLQYDIKRCSAPCVGKISEEEYRCAVRNAKDFLAGKFVKVRDFLKEDMQRASDALLFETAARRRDALRRLETLKLEAQETTGSLVNADVIALMQPENGAAEAAASCVHVLLIRNHTYLGGDTFFLSNEAKASSPESNMESFLQQFYLNREPPPRVLLNYLPGNPVVLEDALHKRYNRKVQVCVPQKGVGRKWVEQALANARQRGRYEAARSMDFATNLDKMAEVFVLPTRLNRVEIYDNSHIQGSYAYGCMVVATREGFDKKAYRQFSVAPRAPESVGHIGGDDFAMMREVFTRRFRDPEALPTPDLLLIDGGMGQVSAVLDILLGYDIHIPVIGVAKGPDRNAGREHFFIPGWAPLSLPAHDPVLHFIQRLRDEAHRFAIGTHRSARERNFTKSQLSEIPGIGDVRKRALLKNFGSVRQIRQASLEELQHAPGMTPSAALAVFRFFH